MDKRVVSLQDKLHMTLNQHYPTFSKYFDNMDTNESAITSKSYEKLEVSPFIESLWLLTPIL